MIKKILFICIFSLFGTLSYGTEFFVTNATELNTAINSAKPGDVIILKNGTWNNIVINFLNNGTENNPIILRAETQGQVIINGKSNLKIGGNYLIVDGLAFKDGYCSPGTSVIEFRASSSILSNYCRLTNTSIVDYNPNSDSIDYKWISLYGTHNRVDHCYLKGKKHMGTALVVWLPSDANNHKPNYHLIDSNYFAYRPVLYDNGGEIIRVGDSGTSLRDSYTTVEYNYFEECNGEIEIISNKSCENIYRYNTFKDCQGTLTLRHGNRCTVEGNFFFCGRKKDSGGVRIIGEDHKVINNYIQDADGNSMKSAITIINGVPNSPLNRYFQVKRAVVAFNTVVNSRVPLNIGAGKSSELTLPPLDCIVANNIFYSTTSPLVTFTDTPINMTWAGNIFYGTYTGFSQLPAGNYNVDPKIAKSSDNIYRLLSGSPAINASDINYSYVTEDMDGQLRIGVNDIGADEYSNEEISIRPMGPHNTGPAFMRAPTSVKKQADNLADEFYLYQNYPNPFNPSTVISYYLSAASLINIIVYDILGSEVIALYEGYKEEGFHQIEWNAGEILSSGIYFVVARTNNSTKTIKALFQK